MQLQDGDTFIRGGRKFLARINPDDMGPPWKEHDGHGPVREVRANHYGHTSKRPGERVLHSNRHTVWLYDWQEACKLARKDGWDAEPIGEPGRIERAVLADFKRMQGWLDGTWCWVGIEVKLLDANDNEEDATALWGIESDFGDYGEEVASQLADELLHPLQQRWRQALAERRAQRSLERLAAVQAAVLA